MNSGFIDSDHWVHDKKLGGGRLIGEACHLMDVCVYLAGSLIDSVCVNSLGTNVDLMTDNASIMLKFKNGSNAVINYFSNGSKKYSKERLEVYNQNQTWIIDNYRTTKAFGVKGFRSLKTKLDKGHKYQFKQLIKKIKIGGNPLINYDQLLNVTKASFAIVESIKQAKWVKVC